ncbi:hypothetical protein MMC25_001774 [Agyrium rufum]|nr:hypothetical protein [Agyrium rufum]
MDFLIRFIQVHETFRKPELEALAKLAGLHDGDMEILEYSQYSPFCMIRLPSLEAARNLIRRSILSKAIYELWGQSSGPDYSALHKSVHERTSSQWPLYSTCSFKFSLDAYQGKRSTSAQRSIIESFSYLSFDGPIIMHAPDEEFTVFEEYGFRESTPKRIFFGRLVGTSDRDAIVKYSLKTRHYISTTSMDAELALVTANLTLAAPGKVMYDPFVGTGSFPIACAHFGALCWGSDIDGRSIRGSKGRNVATSFEQYGLGGRWVDGFIADLTNSPIARIRVSGNGSRHRRFLDGILCDPPYGVREGLKVLGSKEGGPKEALIIDGQPAHLRNGYIPPKKPYSFEAMLNDVLEFAANTLVDDARLSFWMPTANDEDEKLEIPTHSSLELVSSCVQTFNKWSRRLLTYRRLNAQEAAATADLSNLREATAEGSGSGGASASGTNANNLNSFRRRYFQGFKPTSNSIRP